MIGMDIERIRLALPMEPRAGLLMDMLYNNIDELGGDCVVYHRESITVYTEQITELMTPHDREEIERSKHKRWGAMCTCSACNEDFVAGYVSYKQAGMRGIRLAQGDDGALYDGYRDDSSRDHDGFAKVEIADGEVFDCPLCCSPVELIHTSSLRHGRTYQLQVASLENVEGYTAVVYWMVSRQIDESGVWHNGIYPREAIVIDDNGKLVRFSAIDRAMGRDVNHHAWVHRKTLNDPSQAMYYDWASNGSNKVGSVCWDNIPDMAGTGEKTGIAEYFGVKGTSPMVYLLTWRKHKNIENLMKAGWGNAVDDAINVRIMKTRYSSRYKWNKPCDIPWVNWKEVKPNRMLGMDKREFATATTWVWNNQEALAWTDYRHAFGGTVEQFRKCYLELGVDAVEMISKRAMQGERGWDIDKVMRYLQKQKMSKKQALEYLRDVRRMATDMAAGRELTDEQLWPHDLVAMHDRLDEQRKAAEDAATRLRYADGFRAVVDKYSALEWTDGNLCIRLPRSNGELIDEGAVLRHCVGGYGKSHISGRDTIFFVRHYRRPERSYYTLDINMTARPKEVQLHGYGNERHGECKQHVHRIPKAVRDFCDRWKREVLLPWYEDQQRKAKNQKPKTKREKENAA